MLEQPAVRRARPEDIPELAAMLARAFLEDPVVCWAYKARDPRPSALERFQATRLRQLVGGEEVWTTDDLSCAALWAAPGHWRMNVREELEIVRTFLPPRLAWRIPLLVVGWHGLERHHPGKTPHFYLAVLGTEPAAQGRGLGSAVLHGVLDQCDADGIGAYLESSKESNIDFYARHGFRVTEEVRLTRGPPMWSMWRDPLP
ncbi:MAG TPA: GNAT family N-acetyltransferase [Solirubrobacteraceae bacterium]|jgi:GNAT superfamily N-acetyltransferase|nr:GNAT family N-acetyltransferase [Solirubrobacteraceae bacterium]